jgi:hypothetical protein
MFTFVLLCSTTVASLNYRKISVFKRSALFIAFRELVVGSWMGFHRSTEPARSHVQRFHFLFFLQRGFLCGNSAALFIHVFDNVVPLQIFFGDSGNYCFVRVAPDGHLPV